MPDLGLNPNRALEWDYSSSRPLKRGNIQGEYVYPIFSSELDCLFPVLALNGATVLVKLDSVPAGGEGSDGQ